MSEHFAVKRITKEYAELTKHPSPHFLALPLENDLFEWHFTLLGPPETPYENGVYHGRLILHTNYPLKPPKFIILTLNGRFETNKEICMSNTSYHPDEWQPAWTIRTMLEGLRSFFPEDHNEGVGAVKTSEAIRKKFALDSKNYKCPNCGVIGHIWESHLKNVTELGIVSPEERKIEERKTEERKIEEEKKEIDQFLQSKSREVYTDTQESKHKKIPGVENSQDSCRKDSKEETKGEENSKENVEADEVLLEEVNEDEDEEEAKEDPMERFKHLPSPSVVLEFKAKMDRYEMIVQGLIFVLIFWTIFWTILDSRG